MGKLVKIVNGDVFLRRDVEEQIVRFEKLLKTIKENEDKLKATILEEMESYGILKINTDHLTINYIAPTDKETFDKNRFKKENPLLHDSYIIMKPVKASIRLKVKK